MKQVKKSQSAKKKRLPIIGWREWVALPELGVDRIKVKVDTGAATSALHAVDLEYYHRKDKTFVRFVVHPLQRTTDTEVVSHAPVVEMRPIKSSSGHITERPVIMTEISFAGETWPIELTLINRDVMGFRMLLGRQALRKKFLVNPSRSYLQGKSDE